MSSKPEHLPTVGRPEVPPHYLLSRSAPAPRTLIDIIYDTAARYPDATAVDDGTVQVTYTQLIRDVEESAADLAARGIGLGDRLGIRMPSGNYALYRAILATLAVGAAYVPVDADDPDERAALVFGEADVAAVITGAGTIPAPGSSANRGAASPGLGDDAWIIFTSGTTGTPKGVAVTHRSAAAFVDAEAQLFAQDHPIGPGDRVLAGLSVAFDASCEEMWLAWRSGACLVPAPRSLVRSGMDLGPWLVARAVTVVSTVPTLATLWQTKELDSVRLLIFGGEACPPELVERLAMDGREIWNTYGPTEATVVACAAPLDAVGPVSIGLPLAGWDLAVIGSQGEIVDYGEVGELVIGGVGLARYLDPDKDAKKFAPIPALGWDRAYRSGDLVRLERDGLYFCGRADDQVKVAGRRIELGEIDAALLKLPGVRAAAAAVRRTASGTTLLVGYVVSAHPEFDLARARTLLAETLPATLVPRLVRVDEIPTRTSGKVDRDALPWPPPDTYEQRDETHGVFVAPRDEVEIALAKIWCDSLGVRAVSVTDHLFEIGADSLLAARISILAREAGYALTPRDLYQNPTLEALAAYARTAQPAAINLSVPESDTPLSPMQRYYMSWAQPNPNKFNLGFIARMPGPLDPELLQAAFRIVREHHPALRLRFYPTTDGGYRQRHESESVDLEVPIHRFCLPAGPDHLRVAFIREQAARLHDSLDISTGPTQTVAVFDDAAGDGVHFFFVLHHLINDAVSLEITLKDLGTAYSALAAGREPVLPSRTTPYHHWIESLIEYANGPAGLAQWTYWLDQARHACPFPEDHDSAVSLQRDLEVLKFQVLSPNEVEEVRARLGGAFHATLIHATVAALALAAHALSGQRNLVFHKTAHGRETCIPGADISRTVGWFVTHTPITVRLPDGPIDDLENLPKILEHVAGQYRAIPDNGLAHSALRYYSDDPRVSELARFDQVKTLFNYVGDIGESSYDGTFFEPPMCATLLDVTDATAQENAADFHQHLYAFQRDGCYCIDLFYTRPNYRPETIHRIASLLCEKTRGMLIGR
jgi:amino acid adenylation domain-containing protein